MENIRKIEVLPVSIQVADSLRHAILTHEYKKGDIINISATAEKLGVSNTPVREALRLLEGAALVELRPNKGALVLGYNRKSVQDYYEIRILLEAYAARQACKAEEQSQIAAALEEGDELLQNWSSRGYADYNRRFHGAIWETTGNQRMIYQMASLWNAASRPANETPERFVAQVRGEHLRILEAILSRDGDLAARRMEEHLTQSMRRMMSYVDDE